MKQAEAIPWNPCRASVGALSSSSITELCQQCTSAFETCTHHESLMKREWAGIRFFDFNNYIDCIGVWSAPKASLDYRLYSVPSNQLLLSNILAMLKNFLAECISCPEAQSGIDAATKKVDWSIKCLLHGDCEFKPEEHEKLRAFLGIMCLRQHTKNGFGVDAQHDVSKLDALSTKECMKISQGLKLSEAQQRLIEVNLRRRNRFLQAQERDRQENVGDHTKASTTQGNSRVQQAEKKASQPVTMALTALRPAGRYPRAPDLPQGATTFKCPCCCETLPAEFAKDNRLWREHLFEDISPYTCIRPDCPTPFATYTTITQWENHSMKAHRACFACGLCKNHYTAFPGMGALTAHIRAQHAESASQIVSRISYTSHSSHEAKNIGTNQCPLCDSTGISHSPEFVRHVLDCIHDFSLYSLPWDRLCQD
ncbi:hypothetical protein J3F84DRAFT_394865 [Trichoderma pleuroticola]